jgi:ABC-type transporter Mla subunit MlaD
VLQDISVPKLLASLRACEGGELRAADSGDDLLRTLCTELGLRRVSKDECRQLYVQLLELAARGSVRIEFESQESSRLVVVALATADTTGDTVRRLNEEVEQLRSQIGELQRAIENNRDTVETAESLIAMAESERGEAQAELEGVRAKLETAQKSFERLTESTDRRITALGQKADRDAATIGGLKEEIERLNQRVKELSEQLEQAKPKLGKVTMTSSPSDRVTMGCGCVIDRVSTSNCTIGEGDHPYMAIATTNEQDPQVLADAIMSVYAPPTD